MTGRDKLMLIVGRYGLTFETYSALIIKQAGRCAACGGAEDNLEIDHCHQRGKKHVRGLLCHPCNSTLGHAREDVHRLLSLIDYLHAHSIPQE